MPKAFVVVALMLVTTQVRAQNVVPKPVGPALQAVVPNPMSLLPADQQHVFTPIDPKWTKTTQWLEPDGNSFRVLEKDPHKPGIFHEDHYYDIAVPLNTSIYRKLLRYSPDGRRTLEIDRDGPTQWDRRLRPDGSTFEYNYNSSTSPGHLVAAFSIRQDNKAISILTNNTGDFIRWNADGDGLDRLLCRDGAILVAESYIHNVCTVLNIESTDGNWLHHEPDVEFLRLVSRAESWTLRGDIVTGQRSESFAPGGGIQVNNAVVPPDDINARILNSRGFGRRSPGLTDDQQSRLRADQAAQRHADYLVRRREVITTASDELKAAGYTLESLGLARFREDPDAPLPPPDPKWSAPVVQAPASPP